MSEFNPDKFITNRPNIPKVELFQKYAPPKTKLTAKQEQFRDEDVVGPVLPPVNYSDEESENDQDEQDYDDNRTEDSIDYEPPPYKQQRKVLENSDDEESDDYVDPAVVARDPALASVLQSKAGRLHPERTKTRGKLAFDKPQFQEDIHIELPTTHELMMKGHSRAITSLAIDNSGSRLCSGSLDYQTRLWDFSGMDKDMHSFRIVEAFEGHPVFEVSWSKDGQHVLLVCGHAQAYLMDREGKKIVETLKGDMYLIDMYQTKGHIATINAGLFHPDSNDHFITCSDDGTIRVFDMNQKLWGICQHLPHKEIVKCFDVKGQKTVPIQLGVRGGVNMALAGCRDGSIQVFNIKGGCVGINKRPQLIFRDAHKPNHNINSLRFLEDGNYFLSNSTDDTIKLWDVRNPSHYVNVAYFHSNITPPTKMALSEHDTLMVTADHHFNKMQKLETATDLVFYQTKTLNEYARIPIGNTAVTDICWHHGLNQIFVGGVDGNIRALFDPKLSKKGCLLCISRRSKYLHAENIEYQREIIAPQAIVLFKEFQVREMTKLIIKKDDIPYRSTKPEMPLTGPGKGGKINGATTVTQFVMRTLHEAPIQEDVRDALLKHDAETRRNPRFVLNAYTKNQPKPIFDTTTPWPEENPILALLKDVCKHCGMKICACKRKVVPS